MCYGWKQFYMFFVTNLQNFFKEKRNPHHPNPEEHYTLPILHNTKKNPQPGKWFNNKAASIMCDWFMEAQINRWHDALTTSKREYEKGTSFL